MSIPPYEKIMRPLLKYVGESPEAKSLAVIRKEMAKYFELTEEDLEERLKSGRPRFANRVRWAAHDLRYFDLLQSPQPGHFEIMPKGRDELNGPVSELSRKYLQQKYGDESLSQSSEDTKNSEQAGEVVEQEADIQDNEQTPEEEIDNALQQIDDDVANQLLKRARGISPASFEQLAVDVLLAMGYGTSGKRTGGRGDGGIDGIINEDELGFNQIGIQAKRYGEDNKVSGELVNAFSGALDRQGLQKGIFITTSSFTPDAKQAIQELSKRIIPIDGELLTELMFKLGIGCKSKPLVKREIDESFWSEWE